MKSKIISTIKIALPIGLGLFLVWWMFKDTTDQDIAEIKTSFREANYFWIFASLFFSILSHMSRAYRWKYTLQPLGHTPKFWNSFFSVMIGYAANLLIPRMGEVSRCLYFSKYSGLKFNKLFGTVIAERVADTILLLLFIVMVVFIQSDVLLGYLLELEAIQKLMEPKSLIILALVGLSGIAGLYWLLKKSKANFLNKIRELMKGIVEGLLSIINMEHKWYFLFHTAFIWLMYVIMFYIAFLSLPTVQEVPMGGILSAFVVGGISIAATNGGLGAYPLGIMGILALYGVNENTGKAFGWIVWLSQTLMVIMVGLASVVLLPLFNKNTEIANEEPETN